MPSEGKIRANADRDAEIRRLHAEGKSLRESGKLLGVSHAAVGYHWKRLHLGCSKYKRPSKYPLERPCAECGAAFTVKASHRYQKLCGDPACNIRWMTKVGTERHAPSPEVIQRAMDLHDEDLSAATIAGLMGVSESTIWTWIRIHRPNRAPSGGWATEARKKIHAEANAKAVEAFRLRETEGLSLAEIASRLGVVKATAKIYVSIGKQLAVAS